MRRTILSLVSATALIAASIAVNSNSPKVEASSAPNFSTLLPACASGSGGFSNKPCWSANPGEDDAGSAHLNECSGSVTNFCYSIQVNGAPAPSELKATVSVGSYKTRDASVEIAGYEANIFLWHVPSGHTLNEESWGVGKRPTNQSGNAGEFDLSDVLTPSSQVTVTIKYKTTALPQYSVLVADQGEMNFALNGQDLTLTLTGKPVRVALESASQTIDFDTEKNDNPLLPWANRCGIPSMRFVVCNVDIADAQPLLFTARSKTFVNSPAADTPAPIWVNTNATYFHFPSVVTEGQSKSIQIKTASPHFLPDGQTVNKGNAAAFIPNGVLAQWQIEKTEAALQSALTSSIVKEGTATTVAATFTITSLGVKVYFPEITYSAPTIKVGQAPKPAVVVKTLRKGKSKSLTSLIKLSGKGKAKWTTSGGCKIKSGNLVAPKKAATCRLTLSQAKYKKTPARRVTINVRVS